jgi:predicted dinucleotide-binding enzyme
MTPAELEAVVRDCVADWFGRMRTTGEIRATDPDAVAETQEQTAIELLKTLRKNELMHAHLIAGDREHAKGAVNAIIDQISGRP